MRTGQCDLETDVLQEGMQVSWSNSETAIDKTTAMSGKTSVLDAHLLFLCKLVRLMAGSVFVNGVSRP